MNRRITGPPWSALARPKVEVAAPLGTSTAAVLTAVMLAASGCSNGASGNGPLGRGGADVGESWCIPDDGVDTTISHGDIELDNLSDRTLTIDSIGFRHVEGGTVVGTYIAPVRLTAAGYWEGVGSEDGFHIHRAKAQPVPGATIPPRIKGSNPMHHAYSFVVGLRRTGRKPMKTTDEIIRYHDAERKEYYYSSPGTGYVWRTCGKALDRITR